MNKTKKTIALTALLGLLLTQFNNCGNYSEPGSSDDSSTFACGSPSCIVANKANLNIVANVGANSTFGVQANLAEFNVGASCNEGGFADNVVIWRLVLNGSVVRDASDPVVRPLGGTPTNAISKCVNGHASLYINLASIPGADPVNRTGLLTNTGSTARASYDLWMDIYGLDAPGASINNTNMKSFRLQLNAE